MFVFSGQSQERCGLVGPHSNTSTASAHNISHISADSINPDTHHSLPRQTGLVPRSPPHLILCDSRLVCFPLKKSLCGHHVHLFPSRKLLPRPTAPPSSGGNCKYRHGAGSLGPAGLCEIKSLQFAKPRPPPGET